MMFEKSRVAVVETCLVLADMGYLAGTGGNLALLVDPEHFLITPSATDYYAMDPASICVMRLADAGQVEGKKSASVEAGLHARVLKARPDCNASVHTHQPIASAYTLLNIPLEVTEQDTAALLGKTISSVSYAPSGTDWLAKRVGQAFDASTHACLMRNHGVVCVGTDMEEAIKRVVALEAACAAFFRAGLADAPTLTAATGKLISDALSFSATTQKRETTP